MWKVWRDTDKREKTGGPQTEDRAIQWFVHFDTRYQVLSWKVILSFVWLKQKKTDFSSQIKLVFHRDDYVSRAVLYSRVFQKQLQ